MPKQKLTTNEFSLSKCRVCLNPANGKHYGIESCFKCKTFFRRAVIQRQSTKCILNEPCINIKKLCRGCRFSKCLRVGMTKEALQPKRDIIGARKVLSESSSIDENPLTDIEQQQLELIQRLTALDNQIRMKKFELISSKKAAKKLAEEIRSGRIDNVEDDFQLMEKTDVSIGTQIDTLAMIEWTRTLPEFNELPIHDRLVLIKRFSSQYLTLENGFFTALQNRRKEYFMLSTGSYMPREVWMIKDKIPSERAWRQEKLWKNMVSCLIDQVINPLKLFKLLPEELLALKVIILFNCGNHSHHEDNTLPIMSKSREMMIECKNKIISALFAFYKSKNFQNYPERFGAIILTISGILSSANVLLETYQIMRLFNYAQFDSISQQLLFNTDELETL